MSSLQLPTKAVNFDFLNFIFWKFLDEHVNNGCASRDSLVNDSSTIPIAEVKKSHNFFNVKFLGRNFSL